VFGKNHLIPFTDVNGKEITHFSNIFIRCYYLFEHLLLFFLYILIHMNLITRYEPSECLFLLNQAKLAATKNKFCLAEPDCRGRWASPRINETEKGDGTRGGGRRRREQRGTGEQAHAGLPLLF